MAPIIKTRLRKLLQAKRPGYAACLPAQGMLPGSTRVLARA